MALISTLECISSFNVPQKNAVISELNYNWRTATSEANYMPLYSYEKFPNAITGM